MTINFNLHAHPDRRLVHVGYDDRQEWYVYDWTEYIRGFDDGFIDSEKLDDIWNYYFSAYFDGESWYLASWKVLTGS